MEYGIWASEQRIFNIRSEPDVSDPSRYLTFPDNGSHFRCPSRFRPRSDPVYCLFRGSHQHRRAPRSQGSRFRGRLTSLWSRRSRWRFLSGGSDGFMHRTCQNLDDLESPSAQPVENRAYLARLKSSSPSLSCWQSQHIRCRHPACRVRQRPWRPNWQCDDADHTRQPPGRRLLLPSPADQDHPSFSFHRRRPFTGSRSYSRACRLL